MIDSIEIIGYKSIKSAIIKLEPINILIGANGSGKTNFLSFFEFLNSLYEQKLTEYVAMSGGADKYLHHGGKVTDTISFTLSFANGTNGYSATLTNGIFTKEGAIYNAGTWDISSFKREANIKTDSTFRSKYVRNYLTNIKKYHFHDTSKNSPFSKLSHIENDIYYLYAEGNNIAAFLFDIQNKNTLIYNRIVKTIQSIAPYFSDFYLTPNDGKYIRLQWKDKYSDSVYGVNDLSDGTMRFIALTTLFLQPTLPPTIIIDEPELGLHPAAIAKLAGMIQSAIARDCQVIVATQSTDLISYFLPEDIVTVDQIGGESKFIRLSTDTLKNWLDEYTIDDLWKRNIIATGQPNF